MSTLETDDGEQDGDKHEQDGTDDDERVDVVVGEKDETNIREVGAAEVKRSVCVRRLVTDTKRAKGCRSSALTTLRPEPSSFSGRTCLLRRSFSRRALFPLPATATGSAGHASRHSAGPAATGLGNQARRRGVYSTDILDIDGESRHGRTHTIPAQDIHESL